MLIHSLTYTLWILLGNDSEESIKLKFIKQGKLYRSMDTRDILIIVSRIIFTESSKVAKCLKLLRREEILRFSDSILDSLGNTLSFDLRRVKL